MIVIGSYTLNAEEMTLSRDELEVALEPKVFEVLLYLCSNSHRYISMDELHDNVWQGRCVSDAAVRRTISKLRLLFNDDHKVPQYIKSLPKRGYKLICHVSAPSASANNSTLDTPDSSTVTILSSGIQSQSSVTIAPDVIPKTTISAAPAWRFIFDRLAIRKQAVFFLIIVLMCLFVASAFRDGLVESSDPTEQEMTVEVITALPGDKMAIAQSADKKLLAFSGRVNQQTGYQVYVKQRDEPNFIPVTRNAFLPGALAFSADNKYLFYSDIAQSNSSLNRISLSNGMGDKVDTLLANYHFIGDIFTSLDPTYVYFSGQKQADQPQYIYQYDLINNIINRITSSTNKDYSDVKGAISPDGKLMAVLRYYKYEKSQYIRVIDLASQEVVFEHYQKPIIYDLQWLNNQQLLFLDKNRLYTIECNESANITVVKNSPKLAKFIVDEQHIIGLSTSKHTENTLFFEQALPFEKWSTTNIYTSFTDSYFLGFQTEIDSKLVLSHVNKISNLGKLNTKNNQVTSYIKTKYSLRALASSSGNLELIKINHRFALFNTDTQGIKYITAGEDFIGDATFSADEKYVYFSIKNYEEWIIFRYHIDNETIDKLFNGFRYIRPFGDNYILATAQGDLFWSDSTNNKQIALNYQLSGEPNTHWDATSDRIYWSSHDLVHTVFHELDLSNVTQPVESIKVFDYNKVRPHFTINHDGTLFIYRQRDDNHSQLIRFSVKGLPHSDS
ncbi:winged helix-turn-helix domain-containing protein [Shewanella japonica]|uniref:winged helix-turn-helix domain-containing protein n=1 Tax=Shewanella japonica TaxID=93973 RepID=UPI0024940A29|nr:winged helix-turn-helix domain-containing protein [Shewanella japonica]